MMHCLKSFGTSVAMGPTWFFEGLACYASRQYYFLYEDYKKDKEQLINHIEEIHKYMDTDFQYGEFYKVVEGLVRFLNLKDLLKMDWSKTDLQKWVIQKLSES